MNTLAITSAPAVSFKQLLEPDKAKYSHKQESYASQIREILKRVNPDDKKGRSWLDFLDKEFDQDVLLKPCENRNKLDVYAVDNSTGVKDILAILSPAKKPKEDIFSEYVYYTIAEVKEENANFLVSLGLILAGILIFTFLGGRNVAQEPVVKSANAVKTELSNNLLHTLPKDTLQLTAKMLK